MQQTTTTLRRMEHVPEGDRTEDRDRAAEEIESWLEEYGWPIQTSRMAEWGEYSRQHYANTLELYYQEQDEQRPKRTDGGSPQITIPDDVDSVKDYLRGVTAGMEL